MADALPRQTMAWAARGAPIQLPQKQKMPREPRMRAIPNNATRDRRIAKLMLSMIGNSVQIGINAQAGAAASLHRFATYSASARCLPG
jgi:hypothetical protein